MENLGGSPDSGAGEQQGFAGESAGNQVWEFPELLKDGAQNPAMEVPGPESGAEANSPIREEMTRREVETEIAAIGEKKQLETQAAIEGAIAEHERGDFRWGEPSGPGTVEDFDSKDSAPAKEDTDALKFKPISDIDGSAIRANIVTDRMPGTVDKKEGEMEQSLPDFSKEVAHELTDEKSEETGEKLDNSIETRENLKKKLEESLQRAKEETADLAKKTVELREQLKKEAEEARKRAEETQKRLEEFDSAHARLAKLMDEHDEVMKKYFS